MTELTHEADLDHAHPEHEGTGVEDQLGDVALPQL